MHYAEAVGTVTPGSKLPEETSPDSLPCRLLQLELIL